MQQWWRNCRQGNGDFPEEMKHTMKKKNCPQRRGRLSQRLAIFATDDVFVWYCCIVNFQLETSEPQLSFGHVCLRVSRRVSLRLTAPKGAWRAGDWQNQSRLPEFQNWWLPSAMDV